MTTATTAESAVAVQPVEPVYLPKWVGMKQARELLGGMDDDIIKKLGRRGGDPFLPAEQQVHVQR